MAHEAGKRLVMKEYKAWAYFQSVKPMMEAARKRRRAGVMREMGLDVDGKPLVEPTSASTKEQVEEQDQVADAGIKTEDVADARTSAEDQDQSADAMDVDEVPSADARTRTEADAGVKTEEGPRMKTEADARMSAEGEDLRADVGIKTEADARTARGLKRSAEDELEDEDRRTIKKFKSEHVGGVFGMVFRAMVKGLAKGGSEGRPLKGVGRARSKTEAKMYKTPTYVLKMQVRPSWEGRRSMLEGLRSVQLTVPPMTGRALGLSNVSQMAICT